MNPERLMIEILITAHSLDPYSARAVSQTWLHGSASLDQPITSNSPGRFKTPITLADLIPSENPSPEDIVIQKEMAQKIRKLEDTSNLTPEQREAFELNLEGYSPMEIARFLGFKKSRQAIGLVRESIKKILANPDFGKYFGSETA